MDGFGTGQRMKLWPILAAIGALTLVFALPAASVSPDRILSEKQLLHFSQGAVAGYLATHSDALEGLAARTPAAGGNRQRGGGGANGRAGRDGHGVFNNDDLGLPQNEESITACPSNQRIVLGGTNDYRGLVETPPSITGWHYSNDGGRSLTNDGRLPPVTTSGGTEIESGGDPVDVASKLNAADTGPGCGYLYASSLAYALADADLENGIAVYRTTPQILETCAGGTDPSCWPVKRLVAEATGDVFLDKEWMDVGVSGAAGEVVWVTYTKFIVDPTAPEGFTSAEIEAVRCDRDLASCTAPIPISYGDNPPDLDVQFSDVTIGQDGRVYVTWSEIICELTGDPDCPPGSLQIFVHKIRVAEPGSTTFSPEQIVYREELPIPFADSPLHANEFRIATYAKNDVAILNGNPRIFLVWDACTYLFIGLDTVCEETVIKLVHSDSPIGATGSWSQPTVLSRGGDNYFPSIVSNDARNPTLAFTWFTNRFDRQFHNRQDVEFTTMNPATLRRSGLRRLTEPSNEPEADPSLEGVFIGDYIEVFATGERAWVHFNANYRQEKVLSQGVPVAQQDNYLVLLGLDNDDDDD